MLEARSYRLQRAGQAPLDVDSELRKLLDGAENGAPTVDEELRDEVRRLVIARNERRRALDAATAQRPATA